MSNETDERIGKTSPRQRHPARPNSTRLRALLGAAVVLGAAAPVVAFSLTVSGAAHTSLPTALQIGNGRVATATVTRPATVGSTAVTSTTTATSTTTTTTTIVVPLTTGKQTTVVAAIPKVSLEDDRGRTLDHLRRSSTTAIAAQQKSN